MTRVDLVFIGGGYRTTTFLASSPELLTADTYVVEAGTSLGAGGFAHYTITSTSVGSRFFQDVDRDVFAGVLDEPVVRRVARAEQPVPIPELVSALDRLGRSISEKLGQRVVLGQHVSRVDVSSHDPGVGLTLDDGTRLDADLAVLATGRGEREHPALDGWRSRTWLSGRVISGAHRRRLEDTLVAAGGRDVVVVGCSHSAMSALGVLIAARMRLQRTVPGFRCSRIIVLRRSPSRLMYPDLTRALEDRVPGRERSIDVKTDVCPKTGIVFRDSGLRHESRRLFCDLWAGDIADCQLLDVEDAGPLLDGAALIVQAMGYHGVAPDIWLDGELLRAADSPARLEAADDGAAIIDGRPHHALCVLRVEPTPASLRDHAAYGSGLYGRLAARLGARPSTRTSR